MNIIPEEKKEVLLEPFAGANNIIQMIQRIGFDYRWKSYDIQPPDNNITPEYKVEKQDTIKNFPQGFHIAITNPPYLAKNSATRNKLNFPDTEHDDLYKVALDVMLKNLDYVAAIIPESFINADIFHERLFAFVSLTCKMFNDTDCPVCLALFIPEEQKSKQGLAKNDFFIYSQNRKLGKYKEIENKKIQVETKNIRNWCFNDKTGNIGIRCIDNTTESSIMFVNGETISSDKIKESSRSLTRVSGLPDNIDVNEFIDLCNRKLIIFREDTYDLFLTSFKGLRKDNKYRRRLDFKTAKIIMDSALIEIQSKQGE